MSKEAGRASKVLPVACNLSEAHLARRRQELAENVFGGVLKVEELDDGYALVFQGDEESALKLVKFVNAERECCPFFAFEILFEPGGGEISLKMRGPEGAKSFIEGEMLALRTK